MSLLSFFLSIQLFIAYNLNLTFASSVSSHLDSINILLTSFMAVLKTSFCWSFQLKFFTVSKIQLAISFGLGYFIANSRYVWLSPVLFSSSTLSLFSSSFIFVILLFCSSILLLASSGVYLVSFVSFFSFFSSVESILSICSIMKLY